MIENIQLQFMVEKIIGKGEDSDPILFSTESSAITGVFDGMGGSGASLCNSEFGESHTKAYVSSRIIRNAIFNHLNNQKDIDSEILKEICQNRLEAEKQKYPSAKSILRSKLVRDYPTTLALAIAKECYNDIEINSYWAGDSRNYLWMKDGFYQISQDDLVNNNDPLENLSNDSALSNCICTDQDFMINHLAVQIPKQPYILLSATDGCFGYFHTPMHFEHLLASSLFVAESCENWEQVLKENIREVTGDDFSLSLVAIGFEHFNDLKEMLGKETNKCLESILKLQKQVEGIQNRLVELGNELDATILTNWKEYQLEYCKYIPMVSKDTNLIAKPALCVNDEYIKVSEDTNVSEEKKDI